jgi:hypothetical protein
VTANEFKKIALSLPEAEEAAHMHHPDFRVGGKIFATLGYPDEKWAMVKLTLEEQRAFVRSNPEVFRPVKGGWGRHGATNVCLDTATAAVVRKALAAAWRNIAPKALLESEEAL